MRFFKLSRYGALSTVLAAGLCTHIATPGTTCPIERNGTGPPVCILSDRSPDLMGHHWGYGIALDPAFPPYFMPDSPATESESRVPVGGESLFREPLSPARWPGLSIHPAVDEWISYFAMGPGRRYLAESLERSAPYIGVMEEIVREEGLPPEVLALVYIESGFDLDAVSRKRAVGPWQFMSRTAKRFGLRVDGYVDERKDPELSTRAAVRYLKYLYGLFDSWPLATASYNSGEGRVLKAISKQNTRDFWSLKLPRQTKEFIPKVTAVLAILGEPERYGFSLPAREDLEYDIVEVNGPVKLSAVASACCVPQATLEGLNPALKRAMTPPTSVSFPLRVPKGSGDLCRRELSKIRRHYVAAGETLSEIAERYDVSVASVSRANSIRNPHRIRQGALLTIPPVVSSPSPTTTAQTVASPVSTSDDVVHYTVRPGDSLWRISCMFGTTVDELAGWNSLRAADTIRPGQVLKIFLSERVAG
jgi:membrane-bound lytic murein transglycosylase D